MCLQGSLDSYFFCAGVASSCTEPEDSRFSSWWSKAVPKEIKKGLYSLIILVAWEIWKHRDHCVSEGGSPCFQKVLLVVHEECNLWCWVGAKALHRSYVGCCHWLLRILMVFFVVFLFPACGAVSVVLGGLGVLALPLICFFLLN